MRKHPALLPAHAAARLVPLACLASLAALALLTSCAKKPKIEPAEPMPQVMEERPAPAAEPPADDSRRRAIQERLDAILKPVYFTYDQSDLTEKSRAVLASIAGALREYPEVSLNVDGHADERGTEEYNLALGDRRAKAVAGYLEGLGVARSRLASTSYGEEKPAEAGNGESAWSLNRRAEFRASF